MTKDEREALLTFAVEEALERVVPDVNDDGREVWQEEYFAIRNALVDLRKLLATKVRS